MLVNFLSFCDTSAAFAISVLVFCRWIVVMVTGLYGTRFSHFACVFLCRLTFRSIAFASSQTFCSAYVTFFSYFPSLVCGL